MAFTLTSLREDAASSGGNFTTGSFTPTADGLIIAISSVTIGGAPATVTITDSVGLSWTKIEEETTSYSSGTGDTLTAWWAKAPSSPSSMTVTFQPSGGGVAHGAVIEITGDVNTTDPIGVTGTDTQRTDTENLTLSGSPALTSVVLDIVATWDTSVATPNVLENHTELFDYVATVFDGHLALQYRLNSTSDTIAWADVMQGTSVGGTDLANSIAFEVKAYIVEREQNSFRFYEDGTESGATAIDAQNTDISRGAEDPFQLRVGTQYGGDDPGAESAELQYKEHDDPSSEWRKVP